MCDRGHVQSVSLIGKRLVISLAGDLHLVIHLMIAGRLHWKAVGAKLERRRGLAGSCEDIAFLVASLEEANRKKSWCPAEFSASAR